MERVADLQLRRLRARIDSGPGHLAPEIRRAAFTNALTGADVAEPLATLTAKIVEGAYKVMATDIAMARAAGYSEDELFELTVSAAAGCGARRLAIVDDLLGQL